MPLASAAKRMAEAGLLISGAAAVSRGRVRGRTLVLAYHNIVGHRSAVDGDSSLHLPLPLFRHQLDAIERFADVVPLAEVISASPSSASSARPRVAITFDDAYRGTIRLALPELARRGLPATVFVPPGFIPDATFWWDDLGGTTGGLSPSDRNTALEQCRGRDADVRLHHASRLTTVNADARLPGYDLRCTSLDELRAAAAAGPVSLGSHTWSHPNLARSTSDELADELSRPLAWLRQEFPDQHLPAISYPYGLESAAVQAAARAAGYAMGFLVAGGWLPTTLGNLLALPRLNVPAGLSADGLALRLSGLFTTVPA